MGFMDKIKDAGRFLKKQALKLVPKSRDDDDTGTPPAVDTSRYLHVSVDLVPIDNPILRKLLGRDYEESKVRQTRNVGNNVMKRVADSVGANNKARRALRSKMKRRAAELRAMAVPA